MRLAHPRPVDMAHERASLIAKLALHSTWPAADLHYLREVLPKFPPARILAGLDQALTELAKEGLGPDFPDGQNADSYMMLVEGLRRLDRLGKQAGALYPSLLAAA